MIGLNLSFIAVLRLWPSLRVNDHSKKRSVNSKAALNADVITEDSTQVDLVLIDVQMSGLLNNFELAQIIRVFKPRLAIIVTSVGSAPPPTALPP